MPVKKALASLTMPLLVACALPVVVRAAGDVLIDDRDVYPESVTSTRAGDLIVGSMKGNLYRAPKGADKATLWVRPDGLNGLQSVFGVLADDKGGRLWVCSVPNPFQPAAQGATTELVSLDLKSGQLKSRHAFPGPRSVCNDMTVAKDGSVYAADTQNGRILKLTGGKGKLEVFGEAEALKGVDGIAFSADGTLYTNIVTRGVLQRIEIRKDGRMGEIVELKLDEKLAGPDGMRLVERNRFLLAEGTSGRISEVTLGKDSATLRTLRTGLNSSPGVTRVGDTAYAIEGKIGYLVDPKLKGQDPGPFRIIAIPLKGEVKP
jgi:sugar lactone lactonase YvrE